ncbi:THOC5 protein, partial [Corythaeola cristata]|nr:THOC5 protein [Corythaeola cristata]
MSSESSKKRKPKVIRTDGGPQEGKRGKGDGDQDVRYYSEECEVDLRDPIKDYELYRDTCQELQRLMAEIQELKSRGIKDNASEIDERRVQSCVHFMTLKKLNRLAHIRLKKGRDQTHEVQRDWGAMNTGQDLVGSEMTPFLPALLVPAVTFVRPGELRPFVAVMCGSNQIPTPRLAEKYKECLTSKEKILKEIEVKKEYLSSLQPRLNSIMQASLPVQEYLFMPFDQAHKQYETARHLPPPLYVLFVQASAYGQACDKKLVVAIEGSVEEAKALYKPPEDSQDDESDSDAEEEQTTVRDSAVPFWVLSQHCVMWADRSSWQQCCLFSVGADENVLHLTFYYLMNLNVMTVKAKVTTAVEMTTAISAGDLLSPDSLLNCLYPGDHGRKTPNPANQFQFDKVGILTLSDYVTELGHPYVWVQKLGGLHFPKDQPQARHTPFPLPQNIELEFRELPYTKDVIEAGLAEDTHLYYMALIERGTGGRVSFPWQFLIPTPDTPRAVSGSLHGKFLQLEALWAPGDVSSLPCTAKLQAAVVLNPGYSTLPPVFSLCLNWKGERTGSNDDNIRAMESEVNVNYKELWGPKPGYQLLTNQLQRLCMVLDVYLETEPHDPSVEGPKEFPQEKMCLRLVRGPLRLKPFKFNYPQGFFSHR